MSTPSGADMATHEFRIVIESTASRRWIETVLIDALEAIGKRVEPEDIDPVTVTLRERETLLGRYNRDPRPPVARDTIAGADIILAIRKAGIPAWTDQTGGGVATIVVGVEPGHEDSTMTVQIGPGTFNWGDADNSTFYVDECYVGYRDADGEEDHDAFTAKTAGQAAGLAIQLWRDIA